MSFFGVTGNRRSKGHRNYSYRNTSSPQKSSKPFIFGIIYRPPDSSKHLSKNFNIVLFERLQTLDNGNKETIIMDDLNVDYLKKDHSEIKDSFKANGFSPLLTSPTAYFHVPVVDRNHNLSIGNRTVRLG